MRKVNFLLIFHFLSWAIIISANQSPLAGIWIGEEIQNNRTDTYTFFISETKNGSFTGFIETKMNGALLPRMDISEIQYDHPHFQFLINTGDLVISYAGNISEDNNHLNGFFEYSNQDIPKKALILKRKEEKASISNSYQYKKPNSNEFPCASLNEVNLDEKRITKLIKNINKGKFGDINALLVLKDGKLVLEEYFNGSNGNQLQQLQSVTKSITSLLVGIAVHKGNINSIEDKVSYFFKGEAYDQGWENVSIKNLLTMSSGIQWIKADSNSPYDKDEKISSLLLKPIIGNTGKEFNYNSAMQILAGVLENSTGMELERFAEKYLFEPLEIKDYLWQDSEVDNLPLCTGSLMLRPLDMVKIGILIQNKGRYKNKQVVSQKWINESTKVQIHVPKNRGDHYGYLWWIRTKSPEFIFAHGLGSQFIFIVPKSNLILVTTGNNMYNNMDLAPFKILLDYILN